MGNTWTFVSNHHCHYIPPTCFLPPFSRGTEHYSTPRAALTPRTTCTQVLAAAAALRDSDRIPMSASGSRSTPSSSGRGQIVYPREGGLTTRQSSIVNSEGVRLSSPPEGVTRRGLAETSCLRSSGGHVSSQGSIGNVIMAAFGQVSVHPRHGQVVPPGQSSVASLGSQISFLPSGLDNKSGGGRGYHSSVLPYRRGVHRQRRRSDQDVE